MAILEVFEKAKKQRKAAEQKKALKNVAVGAAIGATVGAVAGVLLAPKSGKETREELAQAAKEAVEKALSLEMGEYCVWSSKRNNRRNCEAEMVLPFAKGKFSPISLIKSITLSSSLYCKPFWEK